MEPFDQDVLAPSERPSTEALNRGFTADRLALSFFYQNLLSVRTAIANDRAKLQTGFIGDGFKVRPSSPASFTLEVSAGLGYYYDPSVPLVIATDPTIGRFEGVSNVSPWRPLVLGSSVLLNVPAPPAAGQSRYDIIEVRPKRDLADYGQLLRYNQAAADFRPSSAPAFLRFGSTQDEVGQVVAPALSTAPLSYKIGTPAPTGTQIEPDVTPGYVKIGRILVADTATSIDEGVIVDPRPRLGRALVTVKFTMPCTGVSIAPTLLELDAPPGVRVVVTGSFVSGANAEIDIFTGQEPRTLSVKTEVIGSTTPDGPLIPQADSVIKNNVLNSVVAANLLNPAFTSPPGKYAVGENYCSIGVNSIFWDGTAFIPPPAPLSPITYFVTANILY